ncbi:Crp/Fnr family transcriptional regulator [Galbibacter sp. EGI 63066]|uniref:Crp/Fnr family transcriptional regulator n=1 Tax=Galbibacter sp. EGI 63066 TaxID=2993559 RepID=UPI002248B32F|nr:Crp/Fnr family transcriptional regulator [Galbibacter sp. EGI 63066]MCX2679742.1 Crp/Fnr family transcriptional regulator [Galbibacter sp. EGI 63066]
MLDTIKEKLNYLLDDTIIEELLRIGRVKSFYKDDIIMDIGQKLGFIPLLLEGSIKVLREDGNGHEILLYFLEEGDTCAMSLTSCLNHSKSKIRAIAADDVKLFMIPSEKMEEWFHTNKSWRSFILESYQVRFDEMIETIDALAFLKMDERLEKYLTDKVKLNGNWTLNITHQEIADDLNTSRVVVSRLLKKLENNQLIKLHRNKIEVLNS